MLDTDVVLGGRYRLVEPIAAGGMGQVWRATDTVLGRTVAVKTLLPPYLEGPRFQDEARMMAALHHPGVIEVYDYGETDTVRYLVMECVDGQALSERLADGPLDVATTLSILAQAAEALHAAHVHGIVHRDVKPGNLLVEADGTVRLVDFGIARSNMSAVATEARHILGTALYIAPEQATGQTVSPATDVYALGAVGYHCLAGQPPFLGDVPIEVVRRHVHDSPTPLPSTIPASVCRLIDRAMAKDPADRFATATAFAVAARVAARVSTDRVEGGPPTLMDYAPVTASLPHGHRSWRPAGVALAGVALAVLVVLSVWQGALDGRSPSTPEPPTRPTTPTAGTVTRPGGGPVAPRPTPTRARTPTPTPSAPSTSEAEPTTRPPTTTAPPEPPPTVSDN